MRTRRRPRRLANHLRHRSTELRAPIEGGVVAVIVQIIRNEERQAAFATAGETGWTRRLRRFGCYFKDFLEQAAILLDSYDELFDGRFTQVSI